MNREPNEMLMAFATTSYGWKQRRRYYRTYDKLPAEYLFGEKMLHRWDLISEFGRNPNNQLTLFIYQAPIELVEDVLYKFSNIFNDAGFPVYSHNVNVKKIVFDAGRFYAQQHKMTPYSVLSRYEGETHESGSNERILKRKLPKASPAPRKRRGRGYP